MKMKLSILLPLFLLLLPVNAVEEKVDNYNNYQSLDLTFKMNTVIDISLTKPQGKLNEMVVDVSFFPRENEFQKNLDIAYLSNPSADISTSSTYTTYVWRNILANEKLTYGINAKVRTNNYLPIITSKIPFPIENLETGYIPYTQASSFIDITPKIEEQAISIVSGETDLYKAVFKVADWTNNNIKYDLSTLTANAVQKSSWVLDNKEGVCDELTNLFISFLRSLGIPAKFVSGMVYSNIDHKWGPHGWAEVYLPGYGWIPYDVTFGQYGWLDPSHIKLKDDTDSGSPSAEYSWKSSGIDVDIGSTFLDTSFTSAGPEREPFLKVEIAPYKKAAAPGSYIPLLATIENTKNTYASPIMVVRKAPGLVESNVQHTVLQPKETKTVVWTLKIPKDVESNYIYTSTLEVETTFGNTAKNTIKYAKDYDAFTKEKAEEITSSLKEKEEKHKIQQVSFACSTEKERYYREEQVIVTCAITGKGKEVMQLRGCFRDECKDIQLLPGESKQVSFSSFLEESGRYTATLENEGGIVHAFFPIEVTKVPEISITNISPAQVRYDDDVALSFTLVTDSPIHEVNIDFGFDQLSFGEIKEAKKIDITSKGRNLLNGLKFDIIYRDEKNKIYASKQYVTIDVTNVPWYARIAVWMSRLF